MKLYNACLPSVYKWFGCDTLEDRGYFMDFTKLESYSIEDLEKALANASPDSRNYDLIKPVLDAKRWHVDSENLARSELRVPVVNSNTMNISGSTFGNVAQISGSDGSSITQSTTSNDLKSLHEAIDRLLATVKSNRTIDADTKKEAQIEVDQAPGVKLAKSSQTRIASEKPWSGSRPPLVQLK